MGRRVTQEDIQWEENDESVLKVTFGNQILSDFSLVFHRVKNAHDQQFYLKGFRLAEILIF